MPREFTSPRVRPFVRSFVRSFCWRAFLFGRRAPPRNMPRGGKQVAVARTARGARARSTAAKPPGRKPKVNVPVAVGGGENVQDRRELLFVDGILHTRRREFTCAVCNQTFSEARELTTHAGTHLDGPPFRCPVRDCKKHFQSVFGLRRHAFSHADNASSSNILSYVNISDGDTNDQLTTGVPHIKTEFVDSHSGKAGASHAFSSPSNPTVSAGTQYPQSVESGPQPDTQAYTASATAYYQAHQDAYIALAKAASHDAYRQAETRLNELTAWAKQQRAADASFFNLPAQGRPQWPLRVKLST